MNYTCYTLSVLFSGLEIDQKNGIRRAWKGGIEASLPLRGAFEPFVRIQLELDLIPAETNESL